MADPASITAAAAIGSALFAGGGLALSAMNKPTPPTAPAATVPASSPTKPKPAAGSQQQSFLSGVAAGGLPGGGSPGSTGSVSRGNTLLGQ